ncbi:hypothetical protein M5D96_004707 [Drosophila gunungcola]|uniref:Uncharacterized protein n=1 Tax=Drosophila gunungcola TaxID=103775 RepID=A0A9P9YUM0_9MUSC|nr:hypothetical protein M5D96_004707 [Drosophila gunungcola]
MAYNFGNSSEDNAYDDDEVTEGALQVWRTLPERIRQDPSLASFRQEHERLHGDVDPLQAEEAEVRVENGHHEETALANQAFTQIGINVTNEAGQVRVLDGRDLENNNDDQHDEAEPHAKSLVDPKVSYLVQDSHPAGGLVRLHRLPNVQQRACGSAEPHKCS